MHVFDDVIVNVFYSKDIQRTLCGLWILMDLLQHIYYSIGMQCLSIVILYPLQEAQHVM